MILTWIKILTVHRGMDSRSVAGTKRGFTWSTLIEIWSTQGTTCCSAGFYWIFSVSLDQPSYPPKLA